MIQRRMLYPVIPMLGMVSSGVLSHWLFQATVSLDTAHGRIIKDVHSYATTLSTPQFHWPQLATMSDEIRPRTVSNDTAAACSG